MLVVDSGSRRFSLITSGTGQEGQAGRGEPGLADVVTLQRRAAETSSPEDERALYQDTLAEYCWARDVAGLAPATLHALVQPVMEICAFYGVVPWRLGPREVDQHFAGVGKRGHSTIRAKMTKIDGYFAFLEQRYAGEILDGSELWSSLRWTRSIGHDTVATSGFGSRRPPGR